jgi:Flp pilus assembly pilin Flp
MPGPLWALRRLAADETGQDLVEYAFLTLFVALASAAALVALQDVIGAAYSSSSGAVNGLWQPPDPG